MLSDMKLVCGVAMFMCVVMLPLQAMAMSWVVSGKQASELINQGEVTVLDTRSKASFEAGHVDVSQRVTWQEFSMSKGKNHGELLRDDAVLEHRLRAVGVWNDRPVLVVGDPLGGWGEEGRIVWMLRSLGHKNAALVDGGYKALSKFGVKTSSGKASSVEVGDFKIARVGQFSTSKKMLKSTLKKENVTVLDTRELREFKGETPYGESRGGHVPGAKHLYFKDLMDKDGKVLTGKALEKVLKSHGIKGKDAPIVAYCTGGIRSAWVVAILQSAGYSNATNYAGSMWQWAAEESEAYPLE